MPLKFINQSPGEQNRYCQLSLLQLETNISSWRTCNTARVLSVKSLCMVELQRPCWWCKALGLLLKCLLKLLCICVRGEGNLAAVGVLSSWGLALKPHRVKDCPSCGPEWSTPPLDGEGQAYMGQKSPSQFPQRITLRIWGEQDGIKSATPSLPIVCLWSALSRVLTWGQMPGFDLPLCNWSGQRFKFLADTWSRR